MMMDKPDKKFELIREIVSKEDNVKKSSGSCASTACIAFLRQANPCRRKAKAICTNTVVGNLLNREFEQHRPRKVLLTDITYIHPLSRFVAKLNPI